MSAAPPPDVVTYFEPPPAPAELPARLASPFDPSPPHPLARRAAEELQQLLHRGDTAAGFDPRVLEAPGGGKMFGVLVVATKDGRIGYLRGFSGMLDGRWHVDGFAPPLFDPVARDTFWPEGQEELRALALRHASSRDRVEVEHLRAERSRQLWRRLTDSYVLPNARGEQQSLTSLFEPDAPPGGAGDCAAPKLFAWAYAHHLRPLALAEFWWGAPPLNAERRAGEYYPACQSKCGKVLPYMLEGLAVEPAPPGTVHELRRVFEDAWLLIVDKPHGLPSAPSRHAPRRDSALVRLQQESSAALRVVHELDTEASGLLLLAKDPETHAALRRQLARREADLRHVAWLEGTVSGDHGIIELPLRPTGDEGLRQHIDTTHGKHAVTEWRVTQRTGTRTRVSLLPRTRLVHQLRAHAAHPLGLAAPIVGDAVYGHADARLLLHAEALSFTHPRTGERLDFESRPPF
ncbi:RluA family pseudouridine synthase [Pyxidicoccus fallax]|uniref:RluA family pseudouridine synthase n=1 Tax=Pyxidicoccus fallax TaxID=394095 RepID=UPI0031B617F1